MARGRRHPRALAPQPLLGSLVALAVAVPGALAAPRTETAPASGPTGRLLVTLKDDSRTRVARSAASAIAAAGARVAGPVVPRLGLVTVKPAVGLTARATAVALRALPQVQTVEVERRHSLRQASTDPALTTPETTPGTPSGTAVQWWAARQNLPAMWALNRGAGATVAIIDTGVDATHPELSSKLAGTLDNDATAGRGPGTTDEVGHGTHVASLACAGADNGVGLAGAGLDCRLLILKSDLSDSSIAASITQAVDRGADAINMSFGTDGSQPAATPIVRAIDDAFARGVVLVAAAADQPVEEQGDPSNVVQPTGTGADITQGKGLSITAANFAGQRAPFAGFGSQISMAAYGAFGGPGPRGIFGAFPRNMTDLERPTLTGAGCNCRTTFNGDNRYAYVQGTSMAAPMVAAVAAVVRDLNPDLSAADTIRILKSTASRAPGTGWNPDLGWGILDGGAAAAAATVVDRRAPISSVKSTARVVRGSSVLLTVRRADRAPFRLVPSGVAKVELWRSANGGRARRLKTLTSTSSYRVPVKRGSRYTFFTLAVDKAGNREQPPARADTSVRSVSG